MQIYIAQNGQQIGTFTLDDVNSMLEEEFIQASDLAWHQGLDQWQPLDTLKGIVIPDLSIPPPLPTQTPPPLPKTSQPSGVFDSAPPPMPTGFTTELPQALSGLNSQPPPLPHGFTNSFPQMPITSNEKNGKTESSQENSNSVSNSQKDGMLTIGGIFLVIFVVAIVVPFAIGRFLWNNNPTASQHYSELKNVLKNATYDEVPFFGEILTENGSDDVMKKYVDYYSWFTFSFTRIKIGKEDYRFASFGVAGKVFTVGKESAESWLSPKSKQEDINGEKQNNESNIRKALAGEGAKGKIWSLSRLEIDNESVDINDNWWSRASVTLMPEGKGRFRFPSSNYDQKLIEDFSWTVDGRIIYLKSDVGNLKITMESLSNNECKLSCSAQWNGTKYSCKATLTP